jgi:hypothetical protein
VAPKSKRYTAARSRRVIAHFAGDIAIVRASDASARGLAWSITYAFVQMRGITSTSVSADRSRVRATLSWTRSRQHHTVVTLDRIARRRARRSLTFSRDADATRMAAELLSPRRALNVRTHALASRRRIPMTRTLSVLAAGFSLLILSSPGAAHHSFSAEFDEHKPVTLRGTLTRMDWVNRARTIFPRESSCS